MLHIPPTNCLLLTAKQEPYKKDYLLMKNIEEFSPFGITPVEKAHKARTRWYRGPFRRFIDTRFFLKYKKEMDRSNKKF